MKAYNIYYKNILINKTPVNLQTVNDILKQQYIYKRIDSDNTLKIPINSLRVITCTIV